MNHDIAESWDGSVVCACGERFDGPKAAADHAFHFQLERARAALRQAATPMVEVEGE